ncbi:hypothetical protein CHS0354_030140 [Potamilus streckersoni]|uniref:Uncharacterized protein n=1 Tax=Potamilus streckersoni TaxID=2493646 RepID=A0AAE0STE5_9BIVA|nr:hypothetical protein CHS0354_030140 [Potamilus streckersoni]
MKTAAKEFIKDAKDSDRDFNVSWIYDSRAKLARDARANLARDVIQILTSCLDNCNETIAPQQQLHAPVIELPVTPRRSQQSKQGEVKQRLAHLSEFN